MRNNASGMKRFVPNLLTLLRVAMACWLDAWVFMHFGDPALPIVLSFLIFLTDFLDGKLAVIWGCRSRFGAVFDAAADFFYILSFGAVLWRFSVLPFWFLVLVIFKFTEFVVTSNILSKRSPEKPAFVFDMAGRISAAVFYAAPLLAYAGNFIMSQTAYFLVNPLLLWISAAFALASSVYRIYRCLKKGPGGARPRKGILPIF